MKRRLPDSVYNPITFCGTVLALVALAMILFLWLISAFGRESHPYMSLITFMVLPAFLVLGLLIVIVGIIREGRRLRAGKATGLQWLHIDLTDRRYRNGVVLAAGGSFLFLVLSAFGSYQAYAYTDSVAFCGRLCHNVMKPEYTAYLASPHARVPCVECHIGPSAGWYVQSKISGAYQVYSTIFNKYPRPIPTPIADLRPVRATCERCHWPRQFYSAKLVAKTYYLSDEPNSKSQLDLLVKIGGGNPTLGTMEGIHYHMYIANQISYIARDKAHEDIPWVEERDNNGKVTVFQSTQDPLTPDQVRKSAPTIVDCVECHNQPTHIFHNPSESVNLAMSENTIDATIPYVKQKAVAALEAPYKNDGDAMAGIQKSMDTFYSAQYPQVYASRKAAIDQAVKQVQHIYSLNYFPYMRVSWKAYPNHIGHFYSMGCFRCHDGKHVSSTGQVIPNKCDTCHVILAQKVGSGPARVSLTGLKFQHPGNVGDAWKMMPCSDCHGAQSSK